MIGIYREDFAGGLCLGWDRIGSGRNGNGDFPGSFSPEKYGPAHEFFKNLGMAAAAFCCPDGKLGSFLGIFPEHFAFSFGDFRRRTDACTVDTSPT